jgi:hypothetical protein
MRKPANWHHAIMFDIKSENRMSARKAKVTKLKNMLATGKPVFCTIAKIRVRVSHAYGDLVYLAASDGNVMYSIDKLTLFKHTR